MTLSSATGPPLLALLLLALLLAGCGERPASPPEPSTQDPAPMSDAGPSAGDATVGYAHAPVLRLPAFVLPTLDGGSLSRADVAGTPLVLHFWAPWSRPSLADLPVLDSLSRGGDTVQFLGVLETDEEYEAARAVVDSLGLDFPVLLDADGTLAAALGEVAMLPTTLFVDREGTVVHERVGAFMDVEALTARLRYLRTGAPPAPDAAPQAHAISLDRARLLVEEGAEVYDVREDDERLSADVLAPATPAPLTTLSPDQLPDDALRPILFVCDTVGTRARLAAEQALAWGHRRVYYTRGDLDGLFASAPESNGG